MPSELSRPGATEQELAARAAGLKVVGVPADLLRLVRDCRGAFATEILDRFYLPNVLGYAYLNRGLAIGAITRDPDGGLHTFTDPVVELIEPDDFESFAGSGGDDGDPRVVLPRQTVLELLRARGEVTTRTRALCIHDRDGVGACLAASGAARVVALDQDDAALDHWERYGVHGVLGDLRLVSGFPFGVFDLVTSYQLPGDHDESLIHTALGNLAPYGTYLTCFSGAESERMDLIAFLSHLEGVLIITDMREHHGTFVFRAVKVPELRGNPDFLRYYVA